MGTSTSILEADLGEIGTTIELLRTIEKVRPGSGLPILYGFLAQAAVYRGKLPGIGVVYVGSMASGKGDVMKGFLCYKGIETITANSITPAHLQTYTAEGKYHLIISYDANAIADDNDAINEWLNMAGDLIWDQQTGRLTMRLGSVFRTKGAVVFQGSTHRAWWRMRFIAPGQERYLWSGMVKDRIHVFGMLYGPKELRRRMKVGLNPPPISKIRTALRPHALRIQDESNKWPRHYVTKAFDVWWRHIYQGAHSYERGRRYFDQMLRAHAMLNGRDRVTSADIAVFGLFTPHLMLGQVDGFEGLVIQAACRTDRPDTWPLSRMTGLAPEQVEKVAIGSRFMALMGDTVHVGSPFPEVWEARRDFVDRHLI